MLVDRGIGNETFIGNHFIAEAVDEVFENFDFSFGELEVGDGGRGRSFAHQLQYLTGDAGGHRGAVFEYIVYGLDHVGRVGLLQNITVGNGTDAVEYLVVVFKYGCQTSVNTA